MTDDECLMTKERLSPNAEVSIQSFCHLSIRASFVIRHSRFVIILQYAFHFPIPLRVFADAVRDLSWEL